MTHWRNVLYIYDRHAIHPFKFVLTSTNFDLFHGIWGDIKSQVPVMLKMVFFLAVIIIGQRVIKGFMVSFFNIYCKWLRCHTTN